VRARRLVGGSERHPQACVRRIVHRCACDLLPFPENVCLPLLAGELPSSYVNLRLSKAKNGQVKRTRDASQYRDPWRMFGPVALGREHASMIGKVADGTPA
jgi:hypothetical protein